MFAALTKPYLTSVTYFPAVGEDGECHAMRLQMKMNCERWDFTGAQLDRESKQAVKDAVVVADRLCGRRTPSCAEVHCSGHFRIIEGNSLGAAAFLAACGISTTHLVTGYVHRNGELLPIGKVPQKANGTVARGSLLFMPMLNYDSRILSQHLVGVPVHRPENLLETFQRMPDSWKMIEVR